LNEFAAGNALLSDFELISVHMPRSLAFANISLGILMASLDVTMVAVAFPHFTRELGTNILWAGWTMSIYTLAMTMVMPLAGKLSDSLGHRRIFLFSMILFTGSSALCGIAPNIYILILLRFFQGIGGGSFLPSATGIVSDLFPENRQRYIGLLTSVFPIGGIIGPNLGGWIVERYSWRYIFYINVPIGIVLLVVGWLFLQGTQAKGRLQIDYRAAAIFMAGIFLMMLGLNSIAEYSGTVARLLASACILVGIALIWSFLRFQRKSSHPILDTTLLESRPFLAANVFNLLMGMTSFGVFSFIPLYAVSVYGFSALGSGMILTPRSVGGIAAAALTSFALTRWGYRRPLIWGLILASLTTSLLGLGLLAWGWVGGMVGKIAFLGILMLIGGVGMGMMMPPSNNACIELMPDKVATITGLRGMFRTVGGILGISFITMILHLSTDPVIGFRVAFCSYGLGMLMGLPLIFMMPEGRGGRQTTST
jgi:EmrB/QacA subfamily drug resistance transporter